MHYDVIFFTDTPSSEWLSRGYGAYRLASDLRKKGFTVLTVDFCSSLTFEKYKEIIDLCVGSNTLMVGYSTTWFPYRSLNKLNPRYSVGFKSIKRSPSTDFIESEHPWYFESLSHCFSQVDINPWVDYVRAKNPKTKICIGGAKSHEYYYEKNVDNVFLGFAESMLMDYMLSISGKGPKRIFNKIVDYDIKAYGFKEEFTRTQTEYADTDCWVPGELGTFEFARGCIFNCTFCSYPHKGQQTKDYIKDPEVIRQELMDNYHKWGVSRYMIMDDTFNDSVEKLRIIRDVIKTLDFKPKFWAYCRMDLFRAHPEMIPLMKEIGVTEVYYGMETWNDKTAKVIRKGGSLEHKLECFRMAKEMWGDDIYVTVGLVVGLPHDNEEDFKAAAEWFKNGGNKVVHWLNFQALTLNPPLKELGYRFMSDIEKDPSAYNYSFPDLDNDAMEWVRDDEGTIKCKQQANRIMDELTAELMPYQTMRKQMWWQSAFAQLDPRFDFEYLLGTTQEEWNDIFRNFKPSDLYYKWVTTFYWPKFFEKIKS